MEPVIDQIRGVMVLKYNANKEFIEISQIASNPPNLEATFIISGNSIKFYSYYLHWMFVVASIDLD